MGIQVKGADVALPASGLVAFVGSELADKETFLRELNALPGSPVVADEPVKEAGLDEACSIMDGLKALAAFKLVVVVSENDRFVKLYADELINVSDVAVLQGEPGAAEIQQQVVSEAQDTVVVENATTQPQFKAKAKSPLAVKQEEARAAAQKANEEKQRLEAEAKAAAVAAGEAEDVFEPLISSDPNPEAYVTTYKPLTHEKVHEAAAKIPGMGSKYKPVYADSTYYDERLFKALAKDSTVMAEIAHVMEVQKNSTGEPPAMPPLPGISQ